MFDLFLFDFSSEPNDFHLDADRYSKFRGYKYPHLARVFADEPELLDRYDYVWLPDDDVVIGHDELVRFFELCARFNLRLAQPAVGGGSRGMGVYEQGVDYSHEVTAPQPGALLRYTTFVEVMMPHFHTSALRVALPTFTESPSSWGLDFCWAVLLGFRGMGVVDATPAAHTRPLRAGALYRSLSRDGVSHRDDMRGLLARFYRRKFPPRRTLLTVWPGAEPERVLWHYRAVWLRFRLIEALRLRLPSRLARRLSASAGMPKAGSGGSGSIRRSGYHEGMSDSKKPKPEPGKQEEIVLDKMEWEAAKKKADKEEE